MIFCYEKDFAERWLPVVYHDGLPPKTGPNGQGVERRGSWEVPDDCMGSDGEPMFGKLMERFR